MDRVDGRDVRFCNTGGWVLKQTPGGDVLDYPGAEVVVYESGCGIRSVPITSADLTAPAASPPR
jgi:hypothetical protein